jgi:hypothetical protein
MARKRFPEPKKWFPKNPQKYVGDVNNIIVRSSWERRVLDWCDMNSNVIAYSSEETVVNYVCDTDGRVHRYFVDLTVKIRDANGVIKTYLVEIKPEAQTLPPKYPGRTTKRYIEEVETFVKNQSKWRAAKKFAQDRNCEFLILTERHLGIGKSNGTRK